MGWDFCDAWRTKSQAVDGVIESITGFSTILLNHSVVGNTFYGVHEHRHTGERFISVILLAKTRNGGWGYKSMDETMGPYTYTCPAKLIKEAGPTTNAQALAWRDKCKAHAELARAIRGLKTGDVVKLIPGLKGTAHEPLEYGTVANLKPLTITTNAGDRFRIKSTMIAEVFGTPADFVKDHVIHVTVG